MVSCRNWSPRASLTNASGGALGAPCRRLELKMALLQATMEPADEPSVWIACSSAGAKVKSAAPARRRRRCGGLPIPGPCRLFQDRGRVGADASADFVGGAFARQSHIEADARQPLDRAIRIVPAMSMARSPDEPNTTSSARCGSSRKWSAVTSSRKPGAATRKWIWAGLVPCRPCAFCQPVALMRSEATDGRSVPKMPAGPRIGASNRFGNRLSIPARGSSRDPGLCDISGQEIACAMKRRAGRKQE